MTSGLRLAPGPSDGITGLGIIVGGLRAQVEAGALLLHAGPPPADEDDERNNASRDHSADHDHRADHDAVGVRDVLQHPNALDVDLTGDAQADTIVHVAVISSETFLIEAQFDRTFKTIDGRCFTKKVQNTFAIFAATPHSSLWKSENRRGWLTVSNIARSSKFHRCCQSPET